MLPKLSERAATRCTSNITRFYPEWKQAQIRASGDGLEGMEAFIALNKSHLSKLREMIAEGERVCIDAGWPKPDDKEPEQLVPEPEVIIKEVPVEVEKIVEVKVKDPETEAEAQAAKDALQDALSKLEAAQKSMTERKPGPVAEEPPEAIADLFDANLSARENQEALTKKYKDAMSEHYRLLSYGTQEHSIEAQRHLEKAQRLESGINWNRARLAEVI